jgi:basic membrane protein A
MKRLITIICIFALVLGMLAGCNTQSQPAPEDEPSSEQGEGQDKFKVATILPGPINDAGWNSFAYNGVMEAKEDLDVDVAFTENVQPADYESTIHDYASRGYHLIICHGFQMTDAAKSVAEQFPEVKFVVVNGATVNDKNLAAFQFDGVELGFAAGAFAALASKTGVVGMMVGSKAPTMERGLVGFRTGAQYANPDVKVLTAYTDTMEDVAKGKEIALSFIQQKADVVACNANQVGLGSIQACKEKGVMAIGYIKDQYDVAPLAVVVSAIQDVKQLVYKIVQTTKEGSFEPKIFVMGFPEGVQYMSPYHDWEDKLPANTKDVFQKIVDQLEDGSLREQGILPQPITG